jgi:hypothetical protein
MQFLRSGEHLIREQRQLSAPVLNELYYWGFGRKNARMERFGVMTQANRQGAPSRNPVYAFRIQASGASPL